MESKAKLLGHPIHQMLIAFPLGLLATSVAFDIIYLVSDDAAMATVSFWMIAAGVIGGLAAAPFGFIDWLAIPSGTRAKRVGAMHGVGNVIVLALFIVSWLLRQDAPEQPPAIAIALSLIGAGLATVTAWLGGELVDRLGVGVSEKANLNAPSSLRSQVAPEPHPR